MSQQPISPTPLEPIPVSNLQPLRNFQTLTGQVQYKQYTYEDGNEAHKKHVYDLYYRDLTIFRKAVQPTRRAAVSQPVRATPKPFSLLKTSPIQVPRIIQNNKTAPVTATTIAPIVPITTPTQRHFRHFR